MRIEDISKETLTKASDADLFDLRLRTCQVWNRHFHKTTAAAAGSFERADLLNRYSVLMKEMDARTLRIVRENIDGYLLRNTLMQGLDPVSIGEIVLDKGCVVVGGDFAHDPKGAEVCDLFVSPNMGYGDAVKKALNKHITGQISKPVEFHFGQESLGDVHLPLFDLILRPRTMLEKQWSNTEIDLLFCPECEMSWLPGISTCVDCGAEMTNLVPTFKAFDNEIVVSKPGFEETENEVTFRVREPGRFQSDSFRRIALQQSKPRVFAIIGRLTGETSTTIQSLRFPKADGWTIPEARAWVNAHSSVTKRDVIHAGDAEEIEEPEEEKDVEFGIKKVDEQHLVGGVVYEPDVVDADGDYVLADDIRQAAYSFSKNGARVKIMHSGRPIQATVVESYIVPVDFTMEKQVIKAGTWWMTVYIADERAWQAVKAGELTGFSMGGVGRAA
jgi:hypothetical protein